jgi:hypothetical protein
MAKKSKSMRGMDGGRKLASDSGRQRAESGGEKKKPPQGPVATRTGSAKQRKS